MTIVNKYSESVVIIRIDLRKPGYVDSGLDPQNRGDERQSVKGFWLLGRGRWGEHQQVRRGLPKRELSLPGVKERQIQGDGTSKECLGVTRM